MKLNSCALKNSPPIAHIEVEGMSEVVVFAGPNGVGKTSVLTALLNHFRNPQPNGQMRVVVEATSSEERQAWSRDTLDTANQGQAIQLRDHLQKNRKRGQLRSGVLNFDSSRAFETIQPYSWTWDFRDPFDEDIGWQQTFQPAKARFQDVIHSLLRKLRSQKEDISKRALAMQAAGEAAMLLDFPDPLEKFKSAFAQLLPGKTLLGIDERTQKVEYRVGTSTLPLTALSSGEREVVTIVFDFLLRDPQDCVIVFDEPELHLHPELSYRLLRTLRDAGERNQFLYCTHSADIVTASLDQTVVFIAPAQDPVVNQAISVHEDDDAAGVLQLLGQSVGVISLGRRIVLIEGERNSLDKQTYGAIVAADHPDLVLVPAGGKGTLGTFVAALDSVLKKTLWGVEWFMLADGDAAAGFSDPADLTTRSKGRLRLLPRYHVENYFLDENVLASVFAYIEEPKDSWVRDPAQIRTRLRELAAPLVSYGAALKVAHQMRLAAGNVDLMPKGCHGLDLTGLNQAFEDRRAAELARVSAALDQQQTVQRVEATFRSIHDALNRDDDAWKAQVPGRPILNKFAAATNLEVAKLKRLYLKLSRQGTVDPFAEVRAIFRDFSTFAPVSSPPGTT